MRSASALITCAIRQRTGLRLAPGCSCGFCLRPSITVLDQAKDRAYGLRLAAHAASAPALDHRLDQAKDRAYGMRLATHRMLRARRPARPRGRTTRRRTRRERPDGVDRFVAVDPAAELDLGLATRGVPRRASSSSTGAQYAALFTWSSTSRSVARSGQIAPSRRRRGGGRWRRSARTCRPSRRDAPESRRSRPAAATGAPGRRVDVHPRPPPPARRSPRRARDRCGVRPTARRRRCTRSRSARSARNRGV